MTTANSARPRVAVVGAGASGISAGFRLRQAGLDVTVFEADTQVGGRCRTIEREGVRFDVGAGALPSTYAATRRLVADLGLDSEWVRRGAVIGTLRDGRVHRLARRDPSSILTAGHLGITDALSLWRLGRDLARVWPKLNFTDLGTAADLDRETAHDYCVRTYPRAVRENLLEPMLRALLLAEPEDTSVVDLFAACRALLVGGHLLTHPDGVAFFLNRAARLLRVRTATVVTQVSEDDAGVVVQHGESQEHFDAAVLAVPAAATAALHPGLAPRRRAYLEQLRYTRAVVVSLGVHPAPAETSSMVLIPRDVHPDLAVVGLGHNLAPGRAPADCGVLTCFWMSKWSAAHAHDDETKLVAATLGALDDVLPGWTGTVRAHAVAYWDTALASGGVGRYSGLAAFHSANDPDSRIRLAGDYHAQTSIEASVAAGERAAGEITALLTH